MKSFDDIYTAIGRVLPPPCLLILHNNIDKVIRQSSKHRNTLESYRKQKKQSCVTIIPVFAINKCVLCRDKVLKRIHMTMSTKKLKYN